MGLMQRHGPNEQHSTVKAIMVPNVRRSRLETEIVESVRELPS